MPGDNTLIEVRNLHTNFYTYQGVVKALDGINLSIKKGETFGLVGETGCGKSVTANSILRLIPSPPGKIEQGMVLFAMPQEKRERMAELEKELEEKKKAFSEEDMKEIKDYFAAREKTKSKDKRARLESSLTDDQLDYVEKKKEVDSVQRRYDLLQSRESYLRKIRGKYISMIFQEPMSSLNPVFTAGDQIAENLLLHERAEISQAALEFANEEIERLGEYTKARKLNADSGDGDYQCSQCKSMVGEDVDICPECGASFSFEPFRAVRKSALKLHRNFLRIMSENPDAWALRLASKIPILNRYEKLVEQEALERAEEMLEVVKIPDPSNVLTSYPHELSGGMQQRVTIAMALACRPKMLIADEPTTALDVTIQDQILKLMKDLQDEIGTSILLITHDLGVVAETCSRVGVMYAGVMAEIGSVKSIFKEPLHPYTQGLISSIPRLEDKRDKLDIIKGSVPNLVHPPSGCRFNPRCPFAMEVCRNKKPPLIEVKEDHMVACHLYTEGS